MTSSEQYPTQFEKRRDFVIGVVIFVVTNVLMGALSFVPIWLAERFPAANEAFAFIGLIFYCLPWVVNLGLLIYFLVKRKWIAIGMLAAFGVLLLCALLALAIVAGICFFSLGQGQ